MKADHLVKKYRTAEAEARLLQIKTQKAIGKKYSSSENFLMSLRKSIISTPGNENFQELYDFYSTFFTLPSERETSEGFTRAMELNSDELLLQVYGEFEETWIYLRSPIDNSIIAGVNFCTYHLPEKITIKHHISGTCHIFYLFVKPEYRSLGIAKHLHLMAEDYAKEFCGNKGPIWMICEQNAPELMTIEEYFQDSLSALIDQCERLKWWNNLGYKRLNINYIQPPLNPGMESCDTLTLNIRAGGITKVPSEVIREHLERFFCVAVLKGGNLKSHPLIMMQLNTIKSLEEIELSGSVDYYDDLKKSVYDNPRLWAPGSKLFVK